MCLHFLGNDNLETIQLLVEAGANLNYQSASDGETAMHQAAWLGCADAISLLAKLGANPDMTSKMAYATPIHKAVKNCHYHCIRYVTIFV